MKNALFYTLVFALVSISGVFAYYIFANTYKTNQPLFNFQSSNPIFETVEVTLFDTTYKTSAKYIPASEKASSYGRGADIGKVLSEAIGFIGGADEKKFYELDIPYFISSLNLPYKILNSSTSSSNDSEAVYVDKDRYLRNCENSTYSFQFNESKIANDIEEGTSVINLDSYLLNPEVKELINKCEEYDSEKTKIAAVLSSYFKNINAKIPKYFSYSIETNSFEISGANEEVVAEAIKSIRDDFSKEPIDPVYEEIDNSIYLLSYYENGYDLDVENTIHNLRQFLNGESSGFSIATYEVKPSIISTSNTASKPILDFSNEISQGKTRMELMRNGYTNWVIQFADFGLYEVHNHIIKPGEEFSFLSTISPRNGVTKSGFPIDGGICNATTTIFRAALEAGLPISDRSYHYHNVPSYDWPYQLNIVDSAYYTDPKVDLKFVNDTAYPILIRFEKSQKDGYQYNTIKLLTSKSFQDRKVDLINWKKWNIFSPTQFEASFDRVVYEKDKVIRNDNFYSRYLD